MYWKGTERTRDIEDLLIDRRRGVVVAELNGELLSVGKATVNDRDVILGCRHANLQGNVAVTDAPKVDLDVTEDVLADVRCIGNPAEGTGHWALHHADAALILTDEEQEYELVACR